MHEQLYEVWEDSLGDGTIQERLAAELTLEHAIIFMRAIMEQYYNDTQFSLILKHATEGE